MTNITLKTLGRKLLDKRGDRGIREVAKEISISPATLSRVERGYLTDLETFKKVCQWLEVDPGEVLGMKRSPSTPKQHAHVHFKMNREIKQETAEALSHMILAAQRALTHSDR